MKFSVENPRYIAYTNNAFGRTEAGRSNRKAEAWSMAEAATKQAAADRPGINHDAEIFDKGANNGQGSLITRLKSRVAA